MQKSKQKSIFPKSIQNMIISCHKKRLSSEETANKINNSAFAKKLNKNYSKRQMIVALGNITRNHCYWSTND